MSQEKFNAKEAACLLLAAKLHSDYVTATNVFPGTEAEHFAEDWINKNIPDDDSTMATTVWRNFLMILIDNRNGDIDG